MNDMEVFLTNLVRMVARGEMGLHDERNLLVPKARLREMLQTHLGMGRRKVDDLLIEGLLAPAEYQDNGDHLYHVVICLEFVKFLDQADAAGIPLPLQQVFSSEYIPLVWALYSDIDHECADYQEQIGRPLTTWDTAYVRVISDMAVANTRNRMEQEFLVNPDPELVKRLARNLLSAAKRSAAYGVGEKAIYDAVHDIWHGNIHRREGIKEFIKPGTHWTQGERNLVWTGHFDLALCDETESLRLVIEYMGGGHYGQSAETEHNAHRRDLRKKSICEKAGVPLLVLTEEYAYMPAHQDALRFFVRWFGGTRSLAGVEGLLDQALTSLPAGSEAKIQGLELRRRVYSQAQQTGLMAGLLWEIHELAGPNSVVPDLLRANN